MYRVYKQALFLISKQYQTETDWFAILRLQEWLVSTLALLIVYTHQVCDGVECSQSRRSADSGDASSAGTFTSTPAWHRPQAWHSDSSCQRTASCQTGVCPINPKQTL